MDQIPAIKFHPISHLAMGDALLMAGAINLQRYKFQPFQPYLAAKKELIILYDQ
jgi:hypothetical protein